MNTFIGLPVDGLIIMGISILALLFGFWIHEIRSCAKVVRLNRKQLNQAKKNISSR